MSKMYVHYTKTNANIVNITIGIPSSLLVETEENSGITHLLKQLQHQYLLANKERYPLISSSPPNFEMQIVRQMLMYSFSCPAEDIQEGCRQLIDFLFDSDWPEELFQQVKSEVLQELYRFRKTQNFVNAFAKLLCEDAHIGMSVTGNVTTIKCLQLEDLVRLHRDLFHLNNIYCLVAGNITPDLSQLLERLLEEKSHPRQSPIAVLPKAPLLEAQSKLYRPTKKKETGGISFAFRVPREECTYFQFVFFSASMRCKDLDILHPKVREVLSLSTWTEQISYFHQDSFILDVYFEARAEHIASCIELLADNFKHIRHQYTEDIFIVARTTLLKEISHALKDPALLNQLILDYYRATGDFPITLDEFKRGIENVTWDSLTVILRKYVRLENLYLLAESHSKKALEYYIETMASE